MNRVLLSAVALFASIVGTSQSLQAEFVLRLGESANAISAATFNAENAGGTDGVLVTSADAHLLSSGTLPTGISFRLQALASSSLSLGASVGGMTEGLGVTGGKSDAALDNNDSPTESETLSFQISNVTGLEAWQSLVIRNVGVEFGNTHPVEFYSLDGQPESALPLGDGIQFLEVGDKVSFSITALDSSADLVISDSRFVVGGLGFLVVPEPSSTLALCGLVLLRYRRKRETSISSASALL
ncbi:MAG: hypothetical protein AAF483_17435 [Planctomycetota bacterium]